MKTFKTGALALGVLAASLVAPMFGGEADEASKLKMKADKFAYTRRIYNSQIDAKEGTWRPLSDEDINYLAELFEKNFYPGVSSAKKAGWTSWFKNILQQTIFATLVDQLERAFDVSGIKDDIETAKSNGVISSDKADKLLKLAKTGLGDPTFAIKLPSGASYTPAAPSKSVSDAASGRSEEAPSDLPLESGESSSEAVVAIPAQITTNWLAQSALAVGRNIRSINAIAADQDKIDQLRQLADGGDKNAKIILDAVAKHYGISSGSKETAAIAIPAQITTNWLAQSALAVGRNMRSINAIAADQDKLDQLKRLADGGDKNAKIILDTVAKHHKH